MLSKKSDISVFMSLKLLTHCVVKIKGSLSEKSFSSQRIVRYFVITIVIFILQMVVKLFSSNIQNKNITTNLCGNEYNCGDFFRLSNLSGLNSEG